MINFVQLKSQIMTNKLSLKISYAQKLLLLLCSFVLCLILTTVISSLIIHFIPMDTVPFIRATLILQNILVFIVPVAITLVFITTTPISFLRLEKKPSWSAILGMLIIFIVSTPALNAIVLWNESLSLPASMHGIEEWMRNSEKAAKAVTDALLNNLSISGLTTTLLLVGVLTGFSEELFFRGMLQRLIASRPVNAHVAIWVTAVIFSLLHFQFFGFFPRVLLGAFFGYLVLWTGSLWIPIIAHAINNSSVVIVEYLTQNKIIETNINEIGTSPDTIPFTIASVAITVIAIIYSRKYLFKSQNRLD